ncbi:MAG TPA: hypothetical protein VF450_12765 [Noviherbaspirillum sp.]
MPARSQTGHAVLEEKRGRGRPRKPDAMSDAARAKKYRENKRKLRLAGAITPVPPTQSAGKVTDPDESESGRLRKEIDRLELDLAAARTRINDLSGALDLVLQTRARNRKLSADVVKGLYVLLAVGPEVTKATKAKMRR